MQGFSQQDEPPHMRHVELEEERKAAHGDHHEGSQSDIDYLCRVDGGNLREVGKDVRRRNPASDIAECEDDAGMGMNVQQFEEEGVDEDLTQCEATQSWKANDRAEAEESPRVPREPLEHGGLRAIAVREPMPPDLRTPTSRRVGIGIAQSDGLVGLGSSGSVGGGGSVGGSSGGGGGCGGSGSRGDARGGGHAAVWAGPTSFRSAERSDVPAKRRKAAKVAEGPLLRHLHVAPPCISWQHLLRSRFVLIGS